MHPTADSPDIELSSLKDPSHHSVHRARKVAGKPADRRIQVLRDPGIGVLDLVHPAPTARAKPVCKTSKNTQCDCNWIKTPKVENSALRAEVCELFTVVEACEVLVMKELCQLLAPFPGQPGLEVAVDDAQQAAAARDERSLAVGETVILVTPPVYPN